MDDDGMKSGFEPSLPWWFWPLVAIVTVVLAALWVWSDGWES